MHNGVSRVETDRFPIGHRPRPQTPMGEITALPKPLAAVFKGTTSKLRVGKGSKGEEEDEHRCRSP